MAWLIVVAAFAAASYLASLWMHPWAPCRACGASGKTGDRLWRSAFGTCRACGGRGRHPRLGVRVLTPARYKRLAEGQGSAKSIDKRGT